MYINNKCRYQSITQQYLKRCLIKDANYYMFRPIAAIIRFPSEIMVVMLYRIGMVMSLSNENLTMAAIGRNIWLLASFIKHLFRYCCVIDWYLHLLFCLYRSGSLTTAAGELAKYKLDLVDVLEVRWDKGDTVRTGHCIFLYENGSENHQWRTGFFERHGIVSAVTRGEFVSDRMSWIVLRCR